MAENQDPQRIIGRTVYSRSGIRIGIVSETYGHSGQLTWAAVKPVRGPWVGQAGPSHRVVPLAGASVKGSRLVIPFTTETVNKSPTVKTSDASSVSKALAGLLKHYGLSASDDSAQSGGLVSMAGGPLPGPPAGGGDDRPPPKKNTPNATPNQPIRPATPNQSIRPWSGS